MLRVPARMDKRREVMITVFGRWKKIIGLSFSTLLAVKVQISAKIKQRSSLNQFSEGNNQWVLRVLRAESNLHSL